MWNAKMREADLEVGEAGRGSNGGTDTGRSAPSRVGRRPVLRATGGVLGAVGVLSTASTVGAGSDGSDSGTTVAPSEWPMDGFDLSNTRYARDALAVTGNVAERWSFDVSVDPSSGDRYKSGRIQFSSPVIHDGMIIFGDGALTSSENYVHAIDLDTGEHRWRKNMPEINTAVAVGDGRVYAAGNASYVIGLDLDTGEELWRFGTGGRIKGSPKYHDGKVYVGCNDGRFYAINPEKGFREWRHDTSEDADNLRFYGAPVIRDGVVYTSTWAPDDGSAFLYGLDAANGREVWKEQLTYSAGSGASPLAAGEDHLYVPDANRGELLALDLETKDVVWRKEGFEFGRRTGPAVADCRVVVSTLDGHVTGVNAESGEWAWRADTRAAVRTPPMVANGTAYVVDEKGWLYGFAMKGGGKRFEYELGNTAKTTPRTVDEDLIVTGESEVFRLRGATDDHRLTTLCSADETTTDGTGATTEPGGTTAAETTGAGGTDDEGTDDDGTDDEGGSPGFGVVAAVTGLASAAGIGLRRARREQED